ncbi:hypothetical protein Bbelb_319080 [Branchiostoma belcheri]|nr:hypothetical protein Bbelb_319080 [Branchiostoma belcheri]
MPADPSRETCWFRFGCLQRAAGDLVTLKFRFDYASPPGAALVRQLGTTAGTTSVRMFGHAPCSDPESCAEKGLWQCDSGECIQNASVCDGDKDCSSGEDEENCHTPCNGLQLECDGGCLPTYRVCDRLEDCSNGEDEMNCTAGGCGAGQFSCADGTCLLESQLCDNLTECSGGEDEEDCGEAKPPGFPLGLASRYIPDVFLTASSNYKPDFAPIQARHTPLTMPGYCWVPNSVVGQWLQVYLGKTTDVTGVVISGGGSNWDLGSWVTSFTLAFSMDGASWAPYTGSSSDNVQVFQGNRDRYNRVSRPLPVPVTSRYIRLYPTGYYGWVAMVIEVYVTNDENTWLKQDQYVPLGVGLDPDDPGTVPKVPDLDVSASSRRDDFFPWQARLNSGEGQQQGACWSPALRTDTDQWLQIKHDRVYEVAGVITQGAYNLDYWVTSYKLAFSVNGRWTTYSTGDGEEMVFQGNSDSHRYARNLLDHPAYALYTRFYPLSFKNRIALRVEILVIDGSGCASQSVFCNGTCRPRESFCRAFDGCVPWDYNYGYKPICEDVLEEECGLVTVKLEHLGCLEIDSQYSSCGDDEVYHDSQACDGTEDCSTGEDEANCDECAMECLTVLSDSCIPSGWICDELQDCVDGRDEQGCVQGVPKHCFFTCGNNVTCLPTSQLGDGHQDCAGGEDERPSNIEESLGYKWGSCIHNCTSVYGNASCVPDAFVCDGDADCSEEEDEQDCDRADFFLRETEDCGTFYCSLPGSADPYCVHGHLICDGHPDCAAGEDEQGCGGNVPGGMSTQTGTTGSIGPTAEPTSGQGAFQNQTELYEVNCGPQDQPMTWMTAAALGGQILYRMTV